MVAAHLPPGTKSLPRTPGNGLASCAFSKLNEHRTTPDSDALVDACITLLWATACLAIYAIALWYLWGLFLDALSRLDCRCVFGPLPMVR